MKQMLLISTLMAVAFGIAFTSCSRQAGGVAQGGAPEVSTVTVAPQSVVLSTELPGRTTPYMIAEIRPQVSGLILKRLFEEGADVKAGDVLYEIDPTPFQAALDNAKAALGRSEATLPAIRSRAGRFQDLLNDKAVSQQDYDDAAAALRQAEADLQYWKATVETARINLGYTKIVSPISGKIGRSSVTNGAIVTAYQPTALATVQQLDPIYVDVTQSTSEMLRLQRQMSEGKLASDGARQNSVKLTLGDDSSYAHEGTLQFRDVSVDGSTGTVILRMVFPNPQRILLPGMYVRALVKEGVTNQGILVPQQSVMRDTKGGPFVLVVDGEGKAQPRPIKIDRSVGDSWLATDGLVAGQKIIVEGLVRVRPGMPVRAVPFGVATGTKAPTAAQSQSAQKAK